MLGIALALASAIAFSWKALFAKLAYRTGVDATTVLGLRMGFALPAYLGMAFFGARARKSRGVARVLTGADFVRVAGLGFLGYYLSSYLDLFGLTRITAGLERLILFVYPSIVLLFAAFLYKRPVRARELQALALGYAGIVCVFVSDTGRAPRGTAAWLGVLAVFASSLTYSAYLVFAERVVQRLGSVFFTGMACRSRVCSA